MRRLFYRHPEELWAWLRLCDIPRAWTSPTRRLELAGTTAGVLEIEGEPTGLGDGPEVTVNGERVEVAGEPEPLLIARVTAWPTLVQALPWRPATEPAEVTCAVLETPELFRQLARECLLLDNDRLRYAPLGEGRSLLRVEDLNAFLATKWERLPGVRLYQPDPLEPRALLPLGWRYPLSDKLAFGLGEGDHLWLADETTPWRLIPGPLADIYERLEVDPGGLTTVAVEAVDDLPVIRVELRLEPVGERDRPRLWWLDETERTHLEELLREATEEELGNLQIAPVRVADRTGYLLLERLSEVTRLAPPLRGGRAYTSRPTAEGLYLPVGRRLAPVLSRRSLQEALGLGEGHLTIVDETPEGLALTRLNRSALRPVLEILDYFAATAPEPLTAIWEAVSLPPDGAPEPTPRRGLRERLRRWFAR